MYEIKEWNGFEYISECPPEFEEFNKVNLISIKKPMYNFKMLVKEGHLNDPGFSVIQMAEKMECCIVQEIYFIIPQKYPYKLNSFIKVLRREYNMHHKTKFYTIGYMRIDKELYAELEEFRIKKYGEYKEEKREPLGIDDLIK